MHGSGLKKDVANPPEVLDQLGAISELLEASWSHWFPIHKFLIWEALG